jgi:DHA3 family tetracycline resistance protein-like MFS transporter
VLALLRALRHRPFALLWVGQTISILGDKVFELALAWWVLDQTGSAVAMGTVLVLQTAPMLLFLLVGGVVVDRLARSWLLLAADLVRGSAIGAAAVLAFGDMLTIWHVYAFSLVFGVVSAFFQPALRAVLPDVIPAEDLPSANSLVSLSGQCSGLVGPVLGGAIVLLNGTALAFAVDSLSFLVSVACLLPLLGRTGSTLSHHVSSGLVGDLREGIGVVAAFPWLWVTIAVAGLSNIAYTGPMNVALPFLIHDAWQGDAAVLGAFWTAASIGSIVAAAWLGHLPKLRRRGLILYGAWMMVGLFVVAVGLPITIPGILISSFAIGACNSALGLVWVNTLQECVPRQLLGRVTSVDYLGSYALLPVGYVIGGWAAQTLGPSLTFVIGGALQVALVSAGLLHPQIRSFD